MSGGEIVAGAHGLFEFGASAGGDHFVERVLRRVLQFGQRQRGQELRRHVGGRALPGDVINHIARAAGRRARRTPEMAIARKPSTSTQGWPASS